MVIEAGTFVGLENVMIFSINYLEKLIVLIVQLARILAPESFRSEIGKKVFSLIKKKSLLYVFISE
jgi:hypothetical protein